MKAQAPNVDLDRFFAQFEDGVGPVLLLDYDGTLAPFREERDEAIPYPGVRKRLNRILASGGSRVVVISGRAIRDLRPLLGLEPPPELWGSHGWERLRADGTYALADLPEEVRDGLERGEEGLRRVVRDEHLQEKRIEPKPASVALHLRGLPDGRARSVMKVTREEWASLAQEFPLEVHAFDGGLELRALGRDKGTAVREILASECSDLPVAYLGDDTTDEDAFRALGEGGLSVLVRPERRETAAQVWLKPPEELLQFLDLWYRHTSRE